MTTTAKPRKRPATYADLEAVPPNVVAENVRAEPFDAISFSLDVWPHDPPPTAEGA